MIDIMRELFSSTLEKIKEEWRTSGIKEQEIEQRIQMIYQGNAIPKAFEDCAKLVSQHLQETMYQQVLEERAFYAEFVAQHEQIWGNAFVASEAMYIMALESGKECKKSSH